jgi:hypothetical protein
MRAQGLPVNNIDVSLVLEDLPTLSCRAFNNFYVNSRPPHIELALPVLLEGVRANDKRGKNIFAIVL